MLIPKKHLRLSESILGLSAVVLSLILKDNKTIDELFFEIKSLQKKNEVHLKHGFDSLILSLGFLYSIGVVATSEDGKIKKL